MRGTVSGLCAVLVLLAACGDDDDGGMGNEKDSGPSPGRGGSSGSSGSAAGSSGSGAVIKPLGDDVAGDECMTHADCGGATCATQLPGAALTSTPAPGGYCTGQCTGNADCGNGGACLGAIAGALYGQCFARCAGDAECRDGYICGGGVMFGGLVVPDTCRPKPQTDQLADNVAGKPCMAMADCAGGTCMTLRGDIMGMGGTMLPGGYCSGDCTESSQCGAGGVCSPPLFEGLTGYCYEECSEDDDCNREGYRCRTIGPSLRGCDAFPDPLPDDQAGKACATDADCGGVMDTCETTLPGANPFARVPAPDGYCTQQCTEDTDCGAGGVCSGAGLLPGECFKPCVAAADCRTGYTCASRGGGFGTQGADGGMSTGRMVCAPMAMMTPDPEADGGSD